MKYSHNETEKNRSNLHAYIKHTRQSNQIQFPVSYKIDRECEKKEVMSQKPRYTVKNFSIASFR